MADAKLGDIFTIGHHRLMCGDAGNPEHVARLMAGAKADLVFTSPPYAQQRRYVNGIGDWNVLMQRVFSTLPAHEKTQVLVNLGLVHHKGEWVPYWDGWIEWMRTQGWLRFGWYIWDKKNGAPGVFGGRLAPSFEFVFHFNKQSLVVNKTTPCKHTGMPRGNTQRGMRAKSGKVQPWSHKGKPVAENKIPDSVLRLTPENRSRFGHPAVFPVALPAEIIKAYTGPGDIVYEPFAGSGTTIIAAQREGRTCYAMEIEPSYCDIAYRRVSSELSQELLSRPSRTA